ncbi:MAG: FecR domain-containing protein [Kiritimatiellae bacterium]|nr:FecR domain-containing protein [Kiritimatiellia bacterium]
MNHEDTTRTNGNSSGDADDLAIDGLLLEWARGGPAGHADHAFVGRVVAAITSADTRHTRRAGRRLLAVAAAVAILAGAAGVWIWNAPRALPRVARTEGEVRVDGRVARAGMRLRPSARVEIDQAAGLAEIVYPDRAAIRMEGVARLVIHPRGREGDLRLEHGAVQGRVRRQHPDHPFVLVTPHASATVLGTVFRLRVRSDASDLSVTEGIVRLTRLADRASIDVAAGQYATVAPDVAFAPRPISPKPAGPRTLLFHETFDSARPETWTPNSLARGAEAGRQWTAIVSNPFTNQSASWQPDVHIEFCGRGPAGEAASLYEVPGEIRIRLRIRSDKAGQFYFTQQPLDVRTREESLSSAMLDVTPEWREIVLNGSELTPYRRPGVHTPDMRPGMQIGGFALYGYGTGRLFLDLIEVTARAQTARRDSEMSQEDP